MREPGPEISASILGPKTLRMEQPRLLTQEKLLTPERFMCGKAEKANFRCQSELEFVTPEEAKQLKLPRGTTMALHKCVRPGSKEGAFIPVKTAKEALDAAEKFCACVSKAEQPKAPPPPKVNDAARVKCARSRR